MKWEIITGYQRDMQTVAGKCSVVEVNLNNYRVSLNRKELFVIGECSGWNDAMHRAKSGLLEAAKLELNSTLVWVNWTAETLLGRVNVKLWGDGYKLSLGSKKIAMISHPTSLKSLPYIAELKFNSLTEKLITELS